jgi:hypothetical protein
VRGLRGVGVGEAVGDCWISGTQISPTCEAGHNEKMGLGLEETGVGEWERKWTKMGGCGGGGGGL